MYENLSSGIACAKHKTQQVGYALSRNHRVKTCTICTLSPMPDIRQKYAWSPNHRVKTCTACTQSPMPNIRQKYAWSPNHRAKTSLTQSPVGWVLLYVHRNCRFIRDRSPGRPPRLSFSSWPLNHWCQTQDRNTPGLSTELRHLLHNHLLLSQDATSTPDLHTTNLSHIVYSHQCQTPETNTPDLIPQS